MIPPRRPQHTEENTDSWLMSYADMITLLLCFFIIFVSVSDPKTDKFSQITKGLADQFGAVSLVTPFQGPYLTLQGIVESKELYRDVAVEKTDKSVEMELASGSFFERDSAEFVKEKMPVLDELIAAFKSMQYMDYVITVEGHTSDEPIRTPLYPSAWELSSARASKIVRILIDNGMSPDRLKAVGLAGSQPKVSNIDLSGNPIPENRARNQRMVIKLERRS